mgnify:FL=1
MNGSVLLFDNQKGWGFIRGSDNKDYFVHYSNIETDRKRNLSEEDIVSFEVGIGTNGKKQALHVQPILTYKMVKKALKDEGYHIKPIKDQYNINKYIVINSENVVQTDEHGMSFAELAAYAGFSVNEE